MLTFALAAGPEISPAVRSQLEDASPADLPLRPVEHLLWSNPDGTVVLAGWQDDVDLGMGSHWHRRPDGVTAFTGHVWPRSGVWPAGHWAERLADHLETGTVDDLLGIFTAISLDADGHGSITSDALGTSLVYRAQVGSTTVVSSRARVAARLCADGRPRRDLLGVGWLSFSGFPMGSRTGYEGVRVVPLGERIRVGPAGIELRSETPVWQRPLEGDRHALLDEVQADAVTSIRAALSYPVEHRIAELTGGKDTRMIFSILLEAGLADQFEFRTFGDPGLSDVVVAQELAHSHGLRHGIGHEAARRTLLVERRRRLVEAYPDLPPRERLLRLNVGWWDGMRNAWEIDPAVAPSGDRVALNGTYGEAFSTNYLQTNWHRTHADLRQALLVHFKWGSAGILKPGALDHYRDEVMAAAYEGCSSEDAPQDVLDDMYLRHKARRWFGATQETNESNHVCPLHSPFGVRLGFALGTRDRRRQWIYRELYRRTRPELADRPFTSRPWSDVDVPDRLSEPETAPELPRPCAVSPDRPTVGGKVRTLLPRRPRDVEGAAETVKGRQREHVEHEDLEVMRRYLLDDASSPIFDLLDRACVEAALADFPQLRDPAKKQLYGALTAAMWLGGAEITLPPETGG